MRKNLLLLLFSVLLSLPGLARDFEYTYEGQTITYTVIDEDAKTCQTKDGITDEVPGNYVTGDLILPANPKDGETEFTLIELGKYSFYHCDALTSVVIPNSVTSIENDAFSKCFSLVSIEIPNSVTSIKWGTFWECYSLSSMEIPNSITTIETNTFVYCTSLTSIKIPDSVTSIENAAFYGCSGLTSVEIGNGITSIEEGAFEGCDGIKSLVFNAENCGDFYGPVFPTSIESLVIGPQVTRIPSYAFYDCMSLTSVEIPNSVTLIGRDAFHNCSSLASIVIPESVTEIGGDAFIWCSGLTSVSIPNSVKTIGGGTFAFCSNLETLDFGSGVEQIGADIFTGLESLKTVISRNTTPPSVVDWGTTWTSATLYVPQQSIQAYAEAPIWSYFSEIIGFVIEETGITLDKTELNLTEGESFTLTATVTPADATDKTVTWTSSDEAVATVDVEGNVVALNVGTAVITATTANGKSASCTVNVLPILVKSLTIDPTEWTGIEGSEFKITATVLPENAADKTLSFESSDTTVATVDGEGTVKVLKNGTCVITVSTTDGSDLTAECVIYGTSGVDAVFGKDASVDVYDMNGALLKKESDRADLKQLTPGVYILRSGNATVKAVIR